MKKPSAATGKRGRARSPTTEKTLEVGERLNADEFAAIDAWIKATGETMTRSQASDDWLISAFMRARARKMSGHKTKPPITQVWQAT
jgi:hypothetical protein